MKTFFYNLLSFLSFLISFIGIIGIKLIAVSVAVGIAFLTERHFGKFGLTLGWIAGLFVAGIFFIGLQKLQPSLDRLDSYTQTFRKYPFTEKYGRDYKQPIPEEFGITSTEFKDYNSRFQFGLIKVFIIFGVWMGSLIYILKGKVKGSDGFLLMGVAGTIAITLNYIFEYWNKKISMKHRHYPKIHRFQQSLDIYFKIRNENSRI